MEPGTTERAALGRRDVAASCSAAGPWIAATYYNDERAGESFTADGWLRTGDVATIDAEGYIRLVDRTKDLIKSGGEWISSVELENELMGHPKVVEAAVIGVPQEKWSRAAAGVRGGRSRARPSRKEEMLDYLGAAGGQVAGARRRGVHRRGAQDVASASSPRRPSASASPTWSCRNPCERQCTANSCAIRVVGARDRVSTLWVVDGETPNVLVSHA